jgi:glycerate 2-kinase
MPSARNCTLGTVRVLVAPDKFKGTLSAQEAAEAMAAGWRRAFPHADVDVVPMADGGEGTLDALMAALGGERVAETVTGPLGDPVGAEFGVVHTAGGELGVVEMARASGLGLVAAERRNPLRATTRGTGELILAACRRGLRRVMVCIGGSATNDAGAGMAQALGIRLLDGPGHDLRPGGGALVELARIDMRGLDPAVRDASFVVATDVDNPLIGPHGASAVYGPQKGASAADVAELDRALGHFASVVYRDLGVDLRDMPGAGAAGGLGGGLIAFLGARLRPGIDVVMEAVRFAERIAKASLVVTGEGAFDEQSLHGKTVAGVLRAAAEHRVPALVLCGRRSDAVPVPESLGGRVRVYSLADRYGIEAAMERSRWLLKELAAEVAEQTEQRWLDGERS